jgi:hypothetical protein
LADYAKISAHMQQKIASAGVSIQAKTSWWSKGAVILLLHYLHSIVFNSAAHKIPLKNISVSCVLFVPLIIWLIKNINVADKCAFAFGVIN